MRPRDSETEIETEIEVHYSQMSQYSQMHKRPRCQDAGEPYKVINRKWN